MIAPPVPNGTADDHVIDEFDGSSKGGGVSITHSDKAAKLPQHTPCKNTSSTHSVRAGAISTCGEANPPGDVFATGDASSVNANMFDGNGVDADEDGADDIDDDDAFVMYMV